MPDRYPLFLHDLSFGLHAECLYFPDCFNQDDFLMNPEKLELLITRETVSYTHLTLPTNREV